MSSFSLLTTQFELQFDRLPVLHPQQIIRRELHRIRVKEMHRSVMLRPDHVRAFRGFFRTHGIYAVAGEERLIDHPVLQRFHFRDL